jgi:two-component system NtrC family sensor kinase
VANASVSAEVLQRFLERERTARHEAEGLLEERSRQLYQVNVELQRSVTAFQEQVQRTNAIFETAAEGIIIFDEQGTIESLNHAALQIFNLSHEDRGCNVCDLVPSAEFCRDQNECIVSTPSDLTNENNEVVGRRRDGSEVPLELVTSEFTHNGVRTFSAIVRDLSRRRMMEQRLAHAQKMESVGQLAAGIAHELNTPIQFVGDNTRFLKDSFQSISQILDKLDQLLIECSSVEKLKPAAEEIQQLYQKIDLPFLREEIPAAIDQTLDGTENVARIVRAMKVFSHPGTDDFQEIDLNQALASTATISRNEWKYCAELRTEFCADLPRIHCLPGELNQAFLNLIVNAAHAIDSNRGQQLGQLTIKTSHVGQSVLVAISDSGSGIAPEIQSRIFDPFFTTKGVGKGTGQGLSICYNVIVEQHHGKLSFESQVGKGTTFYVELPIRPPSNGITSEAVLEHG